MKSHDLVFMGRDRGRVSARPRPGEGEEYKEETFPKEKLKQSEMTLIKRKAISMASWQFALQLAKEEMAKICGSHTVPQALIVNEECLNGDTSLAGSVRWDPATQTYEAYNVNTHECRQGLVSRQQIEDAMFDLDIANSDWYSHS